jgi:hypothetical protein
MVSPKQREALANRKAVLLAEMNERLDQLPDSYEKEQLILKRNHCESKFPVFPADLTVWTIAYYEDFMRECDRIVSM